MIPLVLNIFISSDSGNNIGAGSSGSSSAFENFLNADSLALKTFMPEVLAHPNYDLNIRFVLISNSFRANVSWC